MYVVRNLTVRSFRGALFQSCPFRKLNCNLAPGVYAFFTVAHYGSGKILLLFKPTAIR